MAKNNYVEAEHPRLRGRWVKKLGSAADAKGFLGSHYGAWRDNLTPAQEKGMRFYQSPGFSLMNGQLRGRDPEVLKQRERASDADLARAKTASRNLAAAIKKAPPLEEPTMVYRGWSLSQLGDVEEGTTVVDKGFISTSLTDDAEVVGKADKKATAEIMLPPGTKAAAGTTRELVLPPGSKFRIVEVTTKGGVPHVLMEYILPPQGRAASA